MADGVTAMHPTAEIHLGVMRIEKAMQERVARLCRTLEDDHDETTTAALRGAIRELRAAMKEDLPKAGA